MIKVLSKNVADKIAAGEVIERPYSVVKELIENAVDAGADAITCEIRNGGKTFLRVTDNGRGIPDEETETAFLRHATSKIEKVDDLSSITSLGFRGEALASIAAVSRVSLITKTAEARMGTRLTLHGGEIIEHAQVGCPEGTTFIVTDLFYNTPARREFLKTDHAESSPIIEFMSQMAIAYTGIRFQLMNNGKLVFSSRGDGNLRNTILSVYQQKEYSQLVDVEYEGDGVHIEGCISRPSLSRTTRRDQTCFVNGRIVRSKVIDKGITRGYRERLFEGRYPVIFLFISIAPNTIDVNIHPNKKEIRFHDEQSMTAHMASAIQQALASDQAIVEATDTRRDYAVRPEGGTSKVAESPSRVVAVHKDFRPEKTEQVDIKSILSTMRQEQEEAKAETVTEESAKISLPAQGPQRPEKPQITIQPPANIPFDINALQVTGNIFHTYITATDEKAFYLIDQHAAQERVFYEKLVGEYLADDKPSQTILTPLLLDVPLEVREDSYDWLDSLRDMGYHIEEFGPGSYIIKEIPYFMEITEAEDFAKDFVDRIREKDDLQNTVVISKLITTSCKRSVKAHDVLSMREMTDLMAQLAECRNPFSCPHGRPTIVRFSEYEIEKMFKRIQ